MTDHGSDTDIDLGQPIDDEEGTRLGTIRGVDEHGFSVTTEDGIEGLGVEHPRSGGAYGEAELTWRCWQCGAVGEIGDLPESCPDCGAPKNGLYDWIED